MRLTRVKKGIIMGQEIGTKLVDIELTHRSMS